MVIVNAQEQCDCFLSRFKPLACLCMAHKWRIKSLKASPTVFRYKGEFNYGFLVDGESDRVKSDSGAFEGLRLKKGALDSVNRTTAPIEWLPIKP